MSSCFSPVHHEFILKVMSNAPLDTKFKLVIEVQRNLFGIPRRCGPHCGSFKLRTLRLAQCLGISLWGKMACSQKILCTISCRLQMQPASESPPLSPVLVKSNLARLLSVFSDFSVHQQELILKCSSTFSAPVLTPRLE